MLGLFGTLNLGARSLQTQQAGIEVARRKNHEQP